MAMVLEYKGYKCQILYAVNTFIYGKVLIPNTDLILEANTCGQLEQEFHSTIDLILQPLSSEANSKQKSVKDAIAKIKQKLVKEKQ